MRIRDLFRRKHRCEFVGRYCIRCGVDQVAPSVEEGATTHAEQVARARAAAASMPGFTPGQPRHYDPSEIKRARRIEADVVPLRRRNG